MRRLRRGNASADCGHLAALLGWFGLAAALAGCAASPAGETAALRSGAARGIAIGSFGGRPFLVASKRIPGDQSDAIVARAIAEHEMRRP